jgi:selenocysteine-specific translation elongation factor
LRTTERLLENGPLPNNYDPQVVSAEGRYAVWKLFAYDPPHANDASTQQAVANKIIIHYRSIINAYPAFDAWLNERGDTFQEYLENHRDADKMPLERLNAQDLEEVFILVNNAASGF